MTEAAQTILPVNPTDIPLEKVKAYSIIHKCTPQEAFAALLSKKLLLLLETSSADEDIKAVVKVLVTSVVGDGSVVKI